MRHDEDCNVEGGGAVCTCGLEDVEATIERLTKERDEALASIPDPEGGDK